MRHHRWYPIALSSLALAVALVAYRITERAEPPRQPATDTMSLPPEEIVRDLTSRSAGLSREAAFVVAGPTNDSGYRSYSLIVDRLACRRGRRPTWVQQGGSVWLYDADGVLGRGTVGAPIGTVAPGACPDRVELRGVRSRHEFVLAAPHGHGVSLPPLFRGARAASDLDASLPPALTQEIRRRAGFHAGAWRLPDGAILFAITEEKDAASEEADEASETEERPAGAALSLGWVDKRGRLRAAPGDCTRGYVAAAVDLNRDGRPELLVDDDRVLRLCRWDGARFVN